MKIRVLVAAFLVVVMSSLSFSVFAEAEKDSATVIRDVSTGKAAVVGDKTKMAPDREIIRGDFE